MMISCGCCGHSFQAQAALTVGPALPAGHPPLRLDPGASSAAATTVAAGEDMPVDTAQALRRQRNRERMRLYRQGVVKDDKRVGHYRKRQREYRERQKERDAEQRNWRGNPDYEAQRREAVLFAAWKEGHTRS
ncbi:hypothetical protein MKEN_00444200 [Mycena kentingensis (nom. inval.)]|nr:hypothetical protein MKEN_00444200 [Mycena kentingensis (nom. inval.)]